MSKIQEIIIEPNKIQTGSTFTLKVKISGDYAEKTLDNNNKNRLLKMGV